MCASQVFEQLKLFAARVEALKRTMLVKVRQVDAARRHTTVRQRFANDRRRQPNIARDLAECLEGLRRIEALPG